MVKKRPKTEHPVASVPAAKLHERFGRNFRLLRKNAGLTQIQVAQISGMHQKEISQVELGKANLTLGTMERLAKAIDHDVTNLLSDAPIASSKK